jgi:hypothetical protein
MLEWLTGIHLAQHSVKAHSGQGPIARHVEKRLPLVVRFGLIRPSKALLRVLAKFVGRGHYTSPSWVPQRLIKRQHKSWFHPDSVQIRNFPRYPNPATVDFKIGHWVEPGQYPAAAGTVRIRTLAQGT